MAELSSPQLCSSSRQTPTALLRGARGLWPDLVISEGGYYDSGSQAEVEVIIFLYVYPHSYHIGGSFEVALLCKEPLCFFFREFLLGYHPETPFSN